MLCVKCEFQNDEGANFCARCSARLPRLPRGGVGVEGEVPRVNDRLQQIEQALDRARSGEWTSQQLGGFIEGIAQVLAEKERSIREIEIPPEAAEDFREELEVGYAGIEMYNRGMARIMDFVREPDLAHLDEGMELVHQGNDLVNEAMRINRENRRKLEELYSDTSTMM